ncbi:unnamed protein product [Dovyalis caffra]|uniref:Uncharacterized protein n=1 Tax=Dovyalis caffra TaxID=77055 RepID=A0AAV1S3Q5_9ROSI|nr:unnamed protein product [Dovyalis caffra]
MRRDESFSARRVKWKQAQSQRENKKGNNGFFSYVYMQRPQHLMAIAIEKSTMLLEEKYGVSYDERV